MGFSTDFTIVIFATRNILVSGFSLVPAKRPFPYIGIKPSDSKQ